MIRNSKRDSNFICNPDIVWGPVCDSTFLEEGLFTRYQFVDDNSDLVPQDHEVFSTIQHLKEIFTQFKDSQN
jgi:hypothetical protein